ncbi:hypothetical protein AB0D57_30845 [Streptomyces sp. NPDC048275]
MAKASQSLKYSAVLDVVKYSAVLDVVAEGNFAYVRSVGVFADADFV